MIDPGPLAAVLRLNLSLVEVSQHACNWLSNVAESNALHVAFCLNQRLHPVMQPI